MRLTINALIAKMQHPTCNNMFKHGRHAEKTQFLGLAKTDTPRTKRTPVWQLGTALH
jgi:hypothetical protein